jgi:hypothetical protein
MPTVAAFVAIQDPNLTIPDPKSGLPVSDRHFLFDLPDVSGGRRGVLFFRVQALEQSTFSFRINSTSALVHNLDKGEGRSFHELYPGSSLMSETNELMLAVSKGTVTFSDIVFFYQVSV